MPLARYTILYHYFRQDEADWIAENIKMSTPERTKNLLDMIAAMWDYYEIAGETIGVFKLIFKNKFNEHLRYYEEMLDNYEKEFDYATATTRTYTNTRTGTTKGDSTSNNTDKSLYVDLPNKKIDENNYWTTPSRGDKTDNENTSTANTSTEEEFKHEETNSELFLRLKNQYLNQIRDLYREFSDRFSSCFLHIF